MQRPVNRRTPRPVETPVYVHAYEQGLPIIRNIFFFCCNFVAIIASIYTVDSTISVVSHFTKGSYGGMWLGAISGAYLVARFAMWRMRVYVARQMEEHLKAAH